MKALIQELKRIVVNRWFIFFLIILIAGCVIFVIFDYYSVEEALRRDYLSTWYENEKINNKRLQTSIAKAKDENIKQELQKELEASQAQLDRIKYKQELYVADYRLYLQEELKEQENEIIQAANQNEGYIDGGSLKELLRTKYIYDNNLRLEEGNSASKILMDFLRLPSVYFVYILVSLIAFAASQHSQKEIEELEAGGIKYSRWKICIVKQTAMFLIAAGITALSILVVFLAGGLLSGFGGGGYPEVLMLENYRYSSGFAWDGSDLYGFAAARLAVSPKKELILKSIPMLYFAVMCTGFVSFAAASVSRMKPLMLLLPVMSIVFPLYFYGGYNMDGIFILNFMNYANPVDMISGNLSGGYSYTGGPPSIGLLVMAFWTVLSMLTGVMVFRVQKPGIFLKSYGGKFGSRDIRFSEAFKSLRWRIIALFAASAGLAVVITVVLAIMAASMSNMGIIGEIIDGVVDIVNNTIGIPLMLVLVVGILSILCFFILSTRIVLYIEEISRNVNIIAGGDFDIKIPVRSADELGTLAKNINTMAEKVKESIREERNAEKTKNELITSVSHDLRTPLTSILGYLGLISGDRYKDEVELRYYVEIAYSKSQRLKKLIEDLFEYTKVSYGGIKLKPVTIDLTEFIEQLAEEFVPLLREMKMEYRLSLPKEKVLVYVDPDMMLRVFENLVSNAIKYGWEGKYLDLELEKHGGKAFVRVINYGGGISESEIPYIFERFYRVEKSRSSETGGAGLGLAIAKNIVELHKGKIRASSAGESTTFEVELSAR